MSEESELFLFQNERSVDSIEEMRPVTGWMQEELYFILPDGRESRYRGKKKSNFALLILMTRLLG